MINNDVSRRGFMQVGALALGGLGLHDVVKLRAFNGTERRDTSVIMLYQHGGASQFETWDMKPDAPTSIRSQFSSIKTVIPGMDICEHFPLQAQVADKFTLIRSLHHDVGIHSDGGIIALTGKRPIQLDPSSQSKSEHPDFGHVASKILGFSRGLPPYVTIPQHPYMTQPTYLGLHHDSFVVGDPAQKGFTVGQLKLNTGRNAQQFANRKQLLSQLDQLRRELDWKGELEGVDEFRQLAYQMLSSSTAAKAFDLSKEPEDLRSRYGLNTWGQSCLLARRLAEAGVPVINIYCNTPKNGPEFTNWDDHPGNAQRPGHFAKYMRIRLPYLDQCLSALIEDIYQRRLDKKILVVVVGEFGRTPKMRFGPPNNSYGRDHWPQAYTALVSGGGFRMGEVIGATNRNGEYPTERPLTPQDLLATIYHHLGIDYGMTIPDYFGRPVHILSKGKMIKELL
ncbi:MAG: DUF1501 domain-containing protein [Planctomycetota bacterium]|nr:DUF1501 domain-containing protein [Planctomycetota bacterium]